MFDHVKCIVSFTTMTCHVYDTTYYKIMAITICDMKFENIKLQQIKWTKLNDIMVKHGFSKLNFKGFMVDHTQTNHNAIRIIYSCGNANVKMVDRK